MVSRRQFLKKSIQYTSLSFIPGFLNASKKQKSKPNIIVILSDDAGYADFGYHGSYQIKTPNIDKIAKEGVKFTSGYVSGAVCSPTRAGLLTGRYQQRFGHEDNLPHKALPGDDPGYMGLPTEEKTIATLLKKEDYKTCAIGKWHLGYKDKFHPCNRGFDHFFGFRGGSSHYFPENHVKIENDMQDAGQQKYLTTAFGEEARKFIRENKNDPFFLYLAFNAVHTPMDATNKDMEKFESIDSKGRKKLAAMTLSMDRQIDKLLKTLKELDIDKNTLLFFLNDNGGAIGYNHSCNAPLNGKKGTFYDGGVKVPFIMRWPGKIPRGKSYKYPVTSLDILPTSLAVAGGKLPKDTKYDGVNLIPFIKGEKKDRPHESLFWRRGSFAAIRHLDYKLIRMPDRPPLLFNLKEDISEQNNIAAENRDIVKNLMQKLWDWEKELATPLWRVEPFWTEFNRKLYDKEYKLKQPK